MSNDFLPSTRRIVLIDFLRGLCLILMTIDHLPHSPLEKLTWQPFGFISAAEAFVFLSGFVTGRVYGATAISQGIATMTGRALRRLRTIYLTNAIFITVAMFAASRGYVALGDGARPSLVLWEKSMVLVMAPSYSEILRLYCVFFVFVPLILWALHKRFVTTVLFASVGLWSLARLGFGMTAIPNSGYFDLLSWQLLFVVGICLGFRPLAIRASKVMRWAWVDWPLTTASIAIVTTLFGVRHGRFFTGTNLSSYWQWLSTWRQTLSIARLLDFFAFSFLIYRFRRFAELVLETMPGRALSFLGRHSLPVFIWSVSTSMFACADRIFPKWMSASPLQQTMLAFLIVGSCFIPAWLHMQWQRLPESTKAIQMAFRLV